MRFGRPSRLIIDLLRSTHLNDVFVSKLLPPAYKAIPFIHKDLIRHPFHLKYQVFGGELFVEVDVGSSMSKRRL